MPEFEPKFVESIQTGATAALILDAVRLFSAECVELVLKHVDDKVISGQMTPELAMGLVSEIAAYRRIVQRIKNKAQQGAKLRESNERTTSPAA